MKQPLFLGVDIGTQGTKSVLCDSTGAVIADAFCPSVLLRPDSETVYEEPVNILNSVVSTVREITRKAGEDAAANIVSMGIDAQMAGIMAIDGDFNAVTPLDSWLDFRCREYTALIKEKAGDRAVLSSGGQIIHSHASKILWWKNEHPEVYKNIAKFIQPNGFVSGKLCGLPADDAFMDYTFLHFNVFSDNLNLKFNGELLDEFGVDIGKMPKIVSPEAVIGTILPEYADKMGLPAGVKMIAGCGDTAASSLGAGITEKGLAYDVAGTASVFACCTDRFSPDVKNRTLLFGRSVIEGLFLPLSYISGGGLCLEWFSRLTGKNLKELDALAQNSSSNKTYFIPHFSGRTLPLDDNVSGAFLGIDSTTDTGAMFRAVMESIAFEYKSYLDILTDSGAINKLDCIYGVGGGAKSPLFSQIKADILGSDYIALSNADSAPAAMALLSGKACGYIEKTYTELFSHRDAENKVYSPDRAESRESGERAKKYLKLLENYSNYII